MYNLGEITQDEAQEVINNTEPLQQNNGNDFLSDNSYDPSNKKITEEEIDQCKQDFDIHITDRITTVKPEDQYPRTYVKIEDQELQKSRERAIKMLMEFGRPDLVDQVKCVLTYEGHTPAELAWEPISGKLMDYGQIAFNTLPALETCEILVGPATEKRGLSDDKGLLRIRQEEIIAKHYNDAQIGVFNEQLDAGFTKSKVTISDKKIEAWLIKNYPEISELERDIAKLSSVARTIKRTFHLILRVASSHETLLRQHPPTR
jgi:hypothetical protein